MSATLERHARGGTASSVDDAVTVITPTIPGRAHLLTECMRSVGEQTVPVIHLVRADVDLAGPAVIRSELLDLTETELVAFVDDDDLLDPDHVEALTDALIGNGADLAWSWCRTVGRAPTVPRPRNVTLAEQMIYAGRNCIPVTVVARVEAIRSAGGFWPMDRYEDHALWLRMLEQGAKFTCLKRETWTYRHYGENRTWV